MTVLGGSEKVRKSGRYARVMGNFWRHPKVETIGDAACGVLVKVWAYCADQGTDRVPASAMRKLYAARRELTAAYPSSHMIFSVASRMAFLVACSVLSPESQTSQPHRAHPERRQGANKGRTRGRTRGEQGARPS